MIFNTKFDTMGGGNRHNSDGMKCETLFKDVTLVCIGNEEMRTANISTVEM